MKTLMIQELNENTKKLNLAEQKYIAGGDGCSLIALTTYFLKPKSTKLSMIEAKGCHLSGNLTN